MSDQPVQVDGPAPGEVEVPKITLAELRATLALDPGNPNQLKSRCRIDGMVDATLEVEDKYDEQLFVALLTIKVLSLPSPPSILFSGCGSSRDAALDNITRVAPPIIYSEVVPAAGSEDGDTSAATIDDPTFDQPEEF